MVRFISSPFPTLEVPMDNTLVGLLGTGTRGLWNHIVGPYNSDQRPWSTGNAWAAAGMARVLATVLKAPVGTFAGESGFSWGGNPSTDLGTSGLQARRVGSFKVVHTSVLDIGEGMGKGKETGEGVDGPANALGGGTLNAVPSLVGASPAPDPSTLDWTQPISRSTLSALLTSWIYEILDAIIQAPLDGGLVRNYVDDVGNEDGLGFGEAAGSALLAGVMYRMAVLVPSSPSSPSTSTRSAQYLEWADALRETLSEKDEDGGWVHFTEDGKVVPTVNPLNWGDGVPFVQGSPEGQAFVVEMYAAWRDCIDAGVCAL